jgi:hypothetical protein
MDARLKKSIYGCKAKKKAFMDARPKKAPLSNLKLFLEKKTRSHDNK